jgi:hypothetical protein
MSRAFAGASAGVKMASLEEAKPGVALLEPEAPPQEVEYFHWAGQDSNGRAYPAGTIHHISGGEKRVTTDGQAVIAPEKAAHFHNGMFKTSDPDIIAVLDRMCLNPGMCMTRDREVYYAHTLTREQRLVRQGNLATSQSNEITRLREELATEKHEKGRLAQMLEEKGKSEK